MFTIILETCVEKKGDEIEYSFMVQNNTTNMAKAPANMFIDSKIPNDMKLVLEAIKKYEE